MRLNGRVFEFVASRVARRPPSDLYHSALVVRVPEGRFVIEQAPVRNANGQERGVVAEGLVASRWAGRWRIFRYEVRRWHDGSIPDIDEAVDSPRRLMEDPLAARLLLELVPQVPTLTWGRDESCAGEMWNANSVIAWLIVRGGIEMKLNVERRKPRKVLCAVDVQARRVTPGRHRQHAVAFLVDERHGVVGKETHEIGEKASGHDDARIPSDLTAQ